MTATGQFLLTLDSREAFPLSSGSGEPEGFPGGRGSVDPRRWMQVSVAMRASIEGSLGSETA